MTIIIRAADLDRDATEILSIQRAAYAAEARLIGVESIPAQHDTAADLRSELIRVAEDGAGSLVGLIGLEEQPELLIARLAVKPAAMRQGIGRALVSHVLSYANGRPLNVGTAHANDPALNLYRSLGFQTVAHTTVADKLPYLRLRHPGVGNVEEIVGA